MAKLIGQCLQAVNLDLARSSATAGVQISRFVILPKELDADDGELTRTRKLRRAAVSERYAQLVEELYGTADHAVVDLPVLLEDGRTETIEARLTLHDVSAREPSVITRIAS